MARPKSDPIERIADEFMRMTPAERRDVLMILRGVEIASRPRKTAEPTAILFESPEEGEV